MIFLNSASSAAALVFYLPGVCTHTDTEGKQSLEYFKIFGKNTIFNEHPVPKMREGLRCALAIPGNQVPGPIILHLVALARLVPVQVGVIALA